MWLRVFAKRWITIPAISWKSKKPEPGADKIDSWPRMPILHFLVFLQAATPRFHFCSTSEKIFFSISPLSSLCFMRYPVTFYTRLFTKRHAVCFFTFFKSSVIIAAIYKTRNCMKYDFWKIRLNALGCFCEYAVPPVFHFRTAWQCSFPQLQAPELHPWPSGIRHKPVSWMPKAQHTLHSDLWLLESS